MRARLLATCALGGLIALAIGVPPSASAAVGITATDNTFAPKTTTVAPGDAVTWVNRGAVAHEVTAVDGSFTSGNIDVGKSFTFTVSKSGSFAYYCRYHGTADSGMTGTLTVRAVSTAAPVGLPKTGGGREVPVGVAVLLLTGVIGASLHLGARPEVQR